MSRLILPGGPTAEGFQKRLQKLERDLMNSQFHIQRLCQTLIEVVMQKGVENQLTIGPPTMAKTTANLSVLPTLDGGLTISVVTNEQAEATRILELDVGKDDE